MYEKGVECLIAHSTTGARREMSGADLAVRPTERTVLVGRLHRMTMIIMCSTQPRYLKKHLSTPYDLVVGVEGRELE